MPVIDTVGQAATPPAPSVRQDGRGREEARGVDQDQVDINPQALQLKASESGAQAAEQPVSLEEAMNLLGRVIKRGGEAIAQVHAGLDPSRVFRLIGQTE